MYNMKHLWFEKGAYANKRARHFVANDLDPNEIQRIAVIRHAALGDQVITRPFLIELRKFFPNATITLSVISNYQYGMPSDLADRVHVTHGSDKKKEITFSQKLDNFKELGDQDIIFDLAATNRSYWLTKLTKAKLKIGFPYRPLVSKLLYDICILRSDFTAEVETMLNMLRILGHNPEQPLDFAYPDHRQLKNTSAPYIVYFNGASQERKMYPFDKMRETLIQASKKFPDHRHIYLEGINDNEKASFLGDLSDHQNIKVQEAMPLENLSTYLAKATAVVCTDTGIRNFAISTHTPTIGIFYATVPFRYTPQVGNHHIVMTPDAQIPSPEQVVTTIAKAIKDN